MSPDLRPRLFVWTTGLLLMAYTPLLAIPSPDVVVNFFASAAQVLGLFTVVLGGFVFSGRRSGRGRGAAARTMRWPFRIALGLLVVSLVANGLQYARDIDERNQRLRANLFRSSTENGKKVGDASLVTLGFGDQLKHPRGIDTADVESMLERGEALNLIDVREPEESQTGMIRGAWHIRYPDLRLARERSVAAGKKTIILCYSGNRSSELVDEFANEGIDCYFLVGGYEKWIAEKRPLKLPPEGRPEGLREIPAFPNKDTLLDTADVKKLVEDEGAIFVDVRYPGDFETGHLPGAVNIPLRKLPSPEMWAQLKALPDKPIIAACYDKRSSFYALILGSRLSTLGYDFGGRYTVPHEYFIARASREHVQQWVEANSETVFGMLGGSLENLLAWIHARVGDLALAILLTVLLLRLSILPLTLKGERDQIVLRQLKQKISDLKNKIGDDRGRFSRALLGLYREHRITSGRNLIGTLLQVVLFIVFFTAVDSYAATATGGFLWLPDLSAADPTFMLSALLAVLIVVHLQVNAVKQGAGFVVLRVLCGVLLFVITFQLRAALNLYLAANVALMFAQNRIVARVLRRRQTKKRQGPLPPRGVVPLRLAHRTPGTGNKAIRLGEMMEAGLPVPDGFVVTDSLLCCRTKLEIRARERRKIAKLWKKLNADKVAVRSSGLNEDGADKSYAGVFESVLNVTRQNFYSALEEVHLSLNSSRACAYGGNENERGGVLVQAMVDAEYSGVLFTEHPTESGSSFIEMVAGLGDALVSGAATPTGYRYGRLSGMLLDEAEPPIDLTPLLRLGRRAEKLFDQPQDIEWAYRDGKFMILQSRHITTSSRAGPSGDKKRRAFECERHRLLAVGEGAGGDDVLFAQNELSELLPRPTPLSLSFMASLWESGGSTDLACRALGFPYDVAENAPPMVSAVFGALYINRLEERKRLRRGPGMVASFRLSRAADGIEKEFREDFAPAFSREIRLREAIDYSRLARNEVFDCLSDWQKRFREETYVQAEIINIAADFYLKLAERELTRRGLSPATYLGNLPKTVVHQAMSLLPAIRRGEKDASEFLDLFGHRAPQDYELAAPRYSEDPALVLDLASRAASPNRHGREEVALDDSGDALLRVAIDRARRFQVLKEEAKHTCLRELALIRKLLLELDRRFDLQGDIFYLTLDEVEWLKNEEFLDEVLLLIGERKEQASYFEKACLPTELTVLQLESLTADGDVRPAARNPGGLRGEKVAGDVEVEGRARVVRHPEEIDKFRDGEILVARFTDPTWTPLFPRAAGVITEVGGMLSHAAIVAREYNVPTIVGVREAMAQIADGDLVTLHLDGSVSHKKERRGALRRSMEAKIALTRQGEIIEALLLNVSQTGALVDTNADLTPGQGVRIRIEEKGAELELGAEVVRHDPSGRYALRFDKPLTATTGGAAVN